MNGQEQIKPESKPTVTTAGPETQDSMRSNQSAGAADTAIPGVQLIEGGATSDDYAVNAAASGTGTDNVPGTEEVMERAKGPLNEEEKLDGGSPAVPDEVEVPREKPSIGIFLKNAINGAHQDRVINIIEEALADCHIGNQKLLDALAQETLKDTEHFLFVIVETMYQLHAYPQARPSAIERRRPGYVLITTDPNVFSNHRKIEIMGMMDGSIRLVYSAPDRSVRTKEDQVFKDTPNASALDVVKSAVEWLAAGTTQGMRPDRYIKS